MKQYWLIVPILLVLVTPLFAEIDQVSNSAPSAMDATNITQTFTAGKDGLLIGVWLYGRSRSAQDSSDVWYVQLYKTEDECLDIHLASGTFIEGDIPTTEDWFYIPFDKPYPQSEGEQLALFIYSDGEFGSGGWIDFGASTQGFDSYTRGQVGCPNDITTTTDYLFQTVIDDNRDDPYAITNPTLVRVTSKNGFGRRLSANIIARNLTTNEIIEFSNVVSVTLEAEPGDTWEFTVDIDDDIVILYDSGATYSYTLREYGYTNSNPISVTAISEQVVEADLLVENLTAREVPHAEVSFRNTYDNNYRIDSKIYDVQVETLYTLQYSYNLSDWYAAATLETSSGSYDPLLSRTLTLLDDWEYVYIRLKVESPRSLSN